MTIFTRESFIVKEYLSIPNFISTVPLNKTGARLTTMKYRWSPINIFVLVSTVLLLASTFFIHSPFGFLLLLVYLTPIFILGLVIDCVLQIFSSSHNRTVLIELVAIVIILMLALTLIPR